jgi:hypothetical protein
VGFAPYRPYPFSRRLAPWPFLWLGCWGVRFTPTLDTGATLHDQSEFDNGTDVLGVFLSAVRQEPAINHTGLATGGNCCYRYVAFGRPGPHSSYRNVGIQGYPYQMKWFDTREIIADRPNLFYVLPRLLCEPFDTANGRRRFGHAFLLRSFRHSSFFKRG